LKRSMNRLPDLWGKRVRVAFIDLDGTLTYSNTSFLFGQYLYRKKKISFIKAFFCAFLYGLHLIHVQSVQRLHISLFRILFFRASKQMMMQQVQDFFSLYGDRIFRPSLMSLLSAFRISQVQLVLLSSSPDFIVSYVAKLLGNLDYHATVYEVDSEGLFSRVGLVMSGENKAKIALMYRKDGYTNEIAVSDSMQDYPLLKVVDEVVVVAPKGRLKRLAKEKNWRIIAS
jgi:phosphoserine phosphatase